MSHGSKNMFPRAEPLRWATAMGMIVPRASEQMLYESIIILQVMQSGAHDVT